MPLEREYQDIEEALHEWWAWSKIRSGKPAGAHSTLSTGYDTEEPNITEGDALLIDREICTMKVRMPEEARALLAFLRCGGNLTLTAKQVRTSYTTTRLYVRNAESWLDGRLFP